VARFASSLVRRGLNEFAPPGQLRRSAAITTFETHVDNLHHPILDRPWDWEIARLEWVAANETNSSHLDVTFTREGELRKLRFAEPQNVSINFDDGHNSIQCGEMVILDVRDRQLDALNVQVTEGGASGSPLRFYAKSVTEIALDI
jgi:hypothetical protein